MREASVNGALVASFIITLPLSEAAVGGLIDDIRKFASIKQELDQ